MRTNIVKRVICVPWAIDKIALAAAFLLTAGPLAVNGQTTSARPLIMTAGATNVTARYITNVIQVSIPTNIFVDVYHTNWVPRDVTNHVAQLRTNWVNRYSTNFIAYYRTNLVPWNQTNVLTSVRYMTNVVTAYATNLQNVSVTNRQNVVQVHTNFVTAYNTNLITAYNTNIQNVTLTNWRSVTVNQTNTVTRPVTNVMYFTNTMLVERVQTNTVIAFQTNFARAFQTNLKTLTLTNWEPVLVMRTNWVTRPLTNFADVQMPGPAPVAASPAPASAVAATATATPTESSSGITASDLASRLEFDLSHIGAPNRPGQFPVRLILVNANGNSLPVHEWRVEKSDGSALVGGTRPEFTGTLPAGVYRLTARVRTTDGSIQNLRGTTEVKSDASEVRTPANGSIAVAR